MAENYETEEERKARQKKALQTLKPHQAEVSGAERGKEGYFTTAGGGPAYNVRETLKPGAEKPKETESGVQSISQKIAQTAGSAMPSRGDWQQKFPDATSWEDSVRLWREQQREKAGPQKAAIGQAKQARQ